MGLLTNRNILVTGGTSGIGEQAVRLFLEEGASVVFTGRRAALGRSLEEKLRSLGHEVHFFEGDVSSSAHVEELFQYLRSEWDSLDGAFNNAGIDGEKAPLVDTSEDEWDRIMDINVKGTFLLLRQELQWMRSKNSGSIVNMASICGLVARPGRSAYNASRHAVIGLTKTAAIEHALDGIRVNAVAPASVRTDIFTRSTGGAAEKQALYAQSHPIGRVAEPMEIAQAALWLLSNNASFVTGHTLVLDGGFTAL